MRDKFNYQCANALEINPDSSTKDIMEILCDLLGIGEPVELVDEDEYESGYEESARLSAVG